MIIPPHNCCPMQDWYKGSKLFWRKVTFSCDDDALASPLTLVQKEYPTVLVGCDPNFSPENEARSGVKLQCNDIALLEKVKRSIYFVFVG